MDIYRVLAVDDEPFNLDLIEAALSDIDNIAVTFANDGLEALSQLHENEFDIVLLDIQMPNMDGLEVLQKVRENPELDTLPILMVTANPEKKNEALQKGASDFLSKPYDIEELSLRTVNYAKLKKLSDKAKQQNEILEQKVTKRTAQLEKSLKLAQETEREISFRLGKASEFRDLETGSHIKRMAEYSKLLAQLYGLSDEECELVLYAAPLHDIGKVGIPDKILLKPGRFEEDEFEIMKQHSQIGAKMLEDGEKYPVISAGYKIALDHHEKYDGSGYPNGKKGDDIDLYARIVAISDVFDALGSKRVYKDAMPLEKTLSIMKDGRGTHFDPKLLDLFLDNVDKFLEIQKRVSDSENAHSILDLIKE
ncbi:MAG: response regulator [Campylobacterota bacterium]|nr:response regulator [Campylobacterota bacterium]